MKNISIIVILCFLLMKISTVLGQNYGNEWINLNQEYFKIQVAENGIYQITYDHLSQAGALEGNPDPRNFQLYFRGEEIAIHLEGQLDGIFDPGDYIYFYGIKNDGSGDNVLYENNAQPHSFYNLYSDSSCYFLTWNFEDIRGKRIPNFTQTQNVDNLPPENYHFARVLKLKTSQFSDGLQYPFYDQNPEVKKAAFDFGEGWTGKAYSRGQTYLDTLINITNRYESGPAPQLEILLAGRNNLSHNVSIIVGPTASNLRSIGISEFERHYNHLFSANLMWTDISSDGNLHIQIIPNGVNGAADRISISYILLSFPQQLNTNGQSDKIFNLPENPGNISYIEIDGIISPGLLWDISDDKNPVNIVYPTPQTTLNTLIPNTSVSKTLIYSENIYSIPYIHKVSFKSINPSQHNYLMVYHGDFTTSAGSYVNPIEAYADYRRTAGFNPLTIEVSMLYDQFNYGEISPQAIRNFSRYMLDNGNPEYLLLIGKALTVNHNYYRKRTDPAFDQFKDWVPTAGNPGSDILFTSYLNGSSHEPAIPTGRIPAKSANEVADYLDKVKEAESFSFNNLWKKDIIQLSGGIQSFEPEVFRYYIDQFKQIEENLYLGGNVTNVSKETTESVEFINITEEVNKGKSLILFFGHSGTFGSDIDIGEVSDPRLGYNNRGKYPLIFMNGCDAGNVFTTLKSFGEDWIVTEEKGAITFTAHSDVGYTRELRRYTDSFLATGYGDSSFIYRPLGDILKETATKYFGRYEVIEEKQIAQVQQTILLGDPFIKLFGAEKPDYNISEDEIFTITIDDQPVTTVTDSFDIAIITKNFGRADTKSFYISIKRTYPDNSIEFLDPALYQPVYYTDTLYYTIKNDPLRSFGLNLFEIRVDPFDSIPELTKNNNTATFNLIINKLGTQNLFPFNYSIVSENTPRLIAQATSISEATRQFIFEVDTSAEFNSTAKQSVTIAQKWIAEWEVDLFKNIPSQDTLVFFWRTRFLDVQPGEENDWTTFSFTYIFNGPEGWAQRNRNQITENNMEGMSYDPNINQWKFNTYENSIEVTTYGANHPERNYEDIILKISGSAFIYNTRLCSDNSLNALAFDRITTNPYKALDFGVLYDILDRRTCGRQPQVINNMLNQEILGSEDYLTRYIDAVNFGDYVLIFSIGEVTFQSWPQNIKDKLLEIGVSSIILDNLSDGEPIIILGKKGDPEGTATVIIGDDSSGTPLDEQEIFINTSITGQSTSGKIVSRLVGPANSWNSFYNTTYSPDTPDNDIFYFSIKGIDANNSETVLFDDIKDQILDITTINPSIYPYLRLTFHTSDTVLLTPQQLRHWMVIYTPLPEGILLPAEIQQLTGINKQEGDSTTAFFNFKNISNKNFQVDSLLVNHILVSQTTLNKQTDSLYIQAPGVGEESPFDIHLKTRNQAGNNDFIVNVNPGLIPERYYTNNILYFKDFLIVKPDNVHPTIDVAFDGRYILDGEIISPTPLISVYLKDENKFIFKEDTTGIILAIKPPDNDKFERIAFSDPNLVWSPASDKKDFTIEYNSPPLVDGIYTLSVQAEDASGNTAGAEPYEIRFEVINESQITNFYPFPNPFSSSTRFVFTLTGSIIPEEIKIQVMTVSGKVVREIMPDEIGPIHIGNNITEYAWDGRDEYGDQLANGVYLYRVILNNPGENFKHRETSGDRGFTKGFGKIYLLR